MRCANCHTPVSESEAVIDHIVPLSRGGGRGADNMRLVHRDCHKRQPRWYVRLWVIFTKACGRFLCLIGRHKWLPIGKIELDWRSKWEAYEVAKEGVCVRCQTETGEIRREYYW